MQQTRNFFVPLLRVVLAWLIVFAIHRLVFVLFGWHLFHDVPTPEIIKSFFYGLRLDLSLIGYVCAFPLLLYVVQIFIPRLKWLKTLHQYYVVFLLIVFSAINIIDVNIFKVWGSKIDYKVLHLMFNDTHDALVSSYAAPWVSSIIILITEVFISLWLIKKIVFKYKTITHHKKSVALLSIKSAVVFGLCFIAIRGGVGIAPINYSAAYFSVHQNANMAALNTEWVLIKSILDADDVSTKQYTYINDENELLNASQSLRNKNTTDSTLPILTMQRPNICLIILESFSADFISSLGGEKNITPQFEQLSSQGLLFTNIYASGDRTYKGLPAILSAQPAFGNKNIIEENSKQQKLPSLSQDLMKQGYANYFLYGGDLQFSNIKSYLLSHGFGHYDDVKTLYTHEANSKWGLHDDITFTILSQQLNTLQTPFFSAYLSLSNHEPFDLPTAHHFGTKDNTEKIKSTAFFTDSCLGDFVEKAKKTKWFDQTLFVVLADHGTNLLRNYTQNFDPRKFRIPLLLFGGALKTEYRGKQISVVGNQTDLIHTLLAQLHLPAQRFFWSQDLLSHQPPLQTHYVFNNGFAVVSKTDTIIFDANANTIRLGKENSSLLNQGKAFYQLNFEQYLAY